MRYDGGRVCASICVRDGELFTEYYFESSVRLILITMENWQNEMNFRIVGCILALPSDEMYHSQIHLVEPLSLHNVSVLGFNLLLSLQLPSVLITPTEFLHNVLHL